MRQNRERPTTPTNSKRACLCWDTNTYSRKCCDGSMYAQGIGSINRTSTGGAFSDGFSDGFKI